MSSDYADKEREFLDTLEADTGRDLAGWMAAIAGTGLAHRDDIIDWLRRQRFTFDRASWLERIHNNGGRPIYAEMSNLKVLAANAHDTPQQQPIAREEAAPERAAAAIQPRVPASRPAASTTAASAATQTDLEALLAKGKAFRPLAQHLLKTITTAHPATSVTTRGSLIALGTDTEFAVIALGGKDVKLGLAFEDGAAREGLDVARMPGAGPAITHMVTLTDVRRIDAALMAHVAAAIALAGHRAA